MTPQEQTAHSKALELACLFYNRVLELEEIIELFCLDAEAAQKTVSKGAAS